MNTKEKVFCKDKKDFCNKYGCTGCEFAKGNGIIPAHYANDVLSTVFGLDYNLDKIRETIKADKEGRCAILPCKVGSVVHVNGNPEKQEIVDCITIYDGGKMTYGFHEFGLSEVFVDEWSEGEVENYVVVGVGTDGGKSNE